MAGKKETFVDDFLGTLWDMAKDIAHTLPLPLEFPYAHVQRIRRYDRRQFYNTVYNLKKRGLIRVKQEGLNKFVELTKKGELQILLAKAVIAKPHNWDGKWRLIAFDIPEAAKEKRNQLRRLLKQNQFLKLQASVYINPYPLNREAILYLKSSGLIDYLRIIKVEEMDSDEDLKKKFHLPKN